ncbi:hypothetical protein G7Y89_g3272 [Cudoniella acicularis]|uniref:Rhodopsin domain-containing protein n=1 Tax=Cudoniella acicularis TaxID=354080 RepID=A0A8H4RSJ2_9HELO|nr:hypothetical protein G7Y89_g3272 [Cudoniella acicularis]
MLQAATPHLGIYSSPSTASTMVLADLGFAAEAERFKLGATNRGFSSEASPRPRMKKSSTREPGCRWLGLCYLTPSDRLLEFQEPVGARALWRGFTGSSQVQRSGPGNVPGNGGERPSIAMASIIARAQDMENPLCPSALILGNLHGRTSTTYETASLHAKLVPLHPLHCIPSLLHSLPHRPALRPHHEFDNGNRGLESPSTRCHAQFRESRKHWVPPHSCRHCLSASYNSILGGTTLFTLGFSTIQIYQTKNGSGYHLWDVPLTKFNEYFYIGGIFGSLTYGMGTLFIKSSILLFYLRLPSSRAIKITTYMLLIVACGYCLPNAFIWVYICQPMQKYWDFSVPGTCLNFNAAFVVAGSLNVATDISMLLLPIWLLWPLHLPRRQKVGVTLILMTGSFVCVVSIIRLVIITDGTVSTDFTWVAADSFIWCIIEMYIGIICACLPSLKIIIKHYYPTSFDDGPQVVIQDLEVPHLQSTNYDENTPHNGQGSIGSSMHQTPQSSHPSITREMQGKGAISKTSLVECDDHPPGEALVT